MSVRRKSTTHDLATLRLHPDGSRVQQSSVNARRRTAASTVIDSRGNWIAKDAGGKTSVKTRRGTSTVRADDAEGEFFDLSGDEEFGTATRRQSKGKQRAHDIQPAEEALPEPELGRLNTRSRCRLSFMRDLSFLDPPPVPVSSLERDTSHSGTASGRQPIVSFSDPDPDLLKAIHHFASCHYNERGQLSDSSRNYRGMNKERRESRKNIHTLAANTLERQNSDSETEHTDTEDELTEEEQDADEAEDAQNSGKDGPKTKGDAYEKDMYKALDGSALMAIGVVLQEYVSHTLSSRTVSEESGSLKRTRIG